MEKIEKKNKKIKLKQETNIGSRNIINEKLKKLDSLKKKEKEYLSKINQEKKKIQNEINLFRKKTNISEEGLSQIKKKNNLSEKELSFFSDKSASEIGSNFKDLSNDNNKELLSEVLSINEFCSNNSNNSKKSKAIKNNNEKIEINNDDLYSIKSKESIASKKTYGKKKIKNLEQLLDKPESNKNIRISVKLNKSNVNKNNNNGPIISLFTTKKSPKINEIIKDISEEQREKVDIKENESIEESEENEEREDKQ